MTEVGTGSEDMIDQGGWCRVFGRPGCPELFIGSFMKEKI